MTRSKESESVFIGIDLGGTTLKGALVSGVGETLQGIRIETERESSDRLFEQIVGAVRTLREDRSSRRQGTCSGSSRRVSSGS